MARIFGDVTKEKKDLFQKALLQKGITMTDYLESCADKLIEQIKEPLENTEIAKAVVEKYPVLNYYKVLESIDIGRSEEEEEKLLSKAEREEMLNNFIDGFGVDAEMKEHPGLYEK